MATDYREVLQELRAEEKRLEDELDAIRSMIPGAELMAKRQSARIVEPSPVAPRAPLRVSPYAGMGIKQAIIHLLVSRTAPVMPAEITRLLLDGGVQTRSNDFAGSVSSTLTQMRQEGIIDRAEEGWVIRHRPDPNGNPPINVAATDPVWIQISNALRQPSLQ